MMRRTNVQREQYWRNVIQDQTESGLPISTFCRERDISAGSFYTWRKKLAHRDQPDTTAKFVPVQLPPSSVPTTANCELVLPNGCRFIMPTQCDPAWLREILGALQVATC